MAGGPGLEMSPVHSRVVGEREVRERGSNTITRAYLPQLAQLLMCVRANPTAKPQAMI
jgi:hypothetical protein